MGLGWFNWIDRFPIWVQMLIGLAVFALTCIIIDICYVLTKRITAFIKRQRGRE
jgi:threonine/homoserine/homoserine lactone efflux protein